MRGRLLACLTLLTMTGGQAFAHHSTANFDQTHAVTITGEVSYFGFTNPHSYIDLAVKQGGKAVPYKVFAPGRVLLVRYDWLPADLKAGDTVTVQGFPDRKNPHFMYLAKITFASGKVWQRSERIPQ